MTPDYKESEQRIKSEIMFPMNACIKKHVVVIYLTHNIL